MQVNTPGRWQSKTLILSAYVDQTESLETEFLIVICRQIAIKTLFLAIFDPRSLIVKSVFDCRLPGVVKGVKYIPRIFPIIVMSPTHILAYWFLVWIPSAKNGPRSVVCLLYLLNQ